MLRIRARLGCCITLGVRNAFFFSILTLMTLVTATAGAIPQGYVSDVQEEREQRFVEVFVTSPPRKSQTELRDAIFNPQLSSEFRTKYQEKFGEMDTESIPYQQSRMTSMIDGQRGVMVQQENMKQRKEFAEFMMKRLTEFHVENYFKTDPTMRPIYEAKKKLENVQVQVSEGVRLDAEYNLSGNTLDLKLKNPWVDAKMVLEMDTSSFGPTSPNETRLWLGRNLKSDLRLNSNAAFTDGIGLVEVVKYLPKNISTSMGASAPFKNGGTSVRETKWLVGFAQSY